MSIDSKIIKLFHLGTFSFATPNSNQILMNLKNQRSFIKFYYTFINGLCLEKFCPKGRYFNRAKILLNKRQFIQLDSCIT